MTTVPPPAKVLVTGANGYIAIWVVRLLLTEYFGKLGFGDKLEIVVVEDIAKEGAFDQAVQGVDAIEHMASPFSTNIVNPQDFIDPAVRGTVGILQSAIKHAPNVKRIVITSSCGAVMAPPPQPTIFSETDWNTTSQLDVDKNGVNADPLSKYRVSKTLAEKAAWEFYERHKGSIGWELVVINAPFVYGPPIQEITGGPESLNTSLKPFYDILVGDGPKTKELLSTSNSWVDVRDTALSHILAIQKEAAAGERIIVCGGAYIWQEWFDAANTIQPYPLPNHPPAKGMPGLTAPYVIQYNMEKGDRLLGIKYKTKVETIRDTLEIFAAKGW